MTSISVVIATYNRAPLLQATLEQLRRQAYVPGDEIIIVDNGSADATPEVIARAAEEFPVPLRCLHESRRGKGPALNAGISAAGGSILALTDDDVLVADNWIDSIRTIFSEASTDLVGGRVDPNFERPLPAWLRLEQHGRYTAMGSPLALLHYGDAQPLRDRTAVGANLAVRRSVVQALGGFDPQLARRSGSLYGAEDHDFCKRAVAAGYNCEYRPEIRVRHWVPANRIRLPYFLRWFFWSGVAHAVLGSDDPVGVDGARRSTPAYYLRQFVQASFRTAARFLRRQRANSAEAAMDVAFALGYLTCHRAAWVIGARHTARHAFADSYGDLIPPAQSHGRSSSGEVRR